MFSRIFQVAVRCFCKTYFYRRARDGPKWQKFVDKNSSKIYLKAKFHRRYGHGLDEAWVLIQPIGWPEMIDNISEIMASYNENMHGGK